MKKYLLALMIVLLACTSVFAAIVDPEAALDADAYSCVDVMKDVLDGYEGAEELEAKIEKIFSMMDALSEETVEAVIEKVLADAEKNDLDGDVLIDNLLAALEAEMSEVAEPVEVVEVVEDVEVKEPVLEAAEAPVED